LYSCSAESYFTNNQYDSCEVGDLSGKGGALTVNQAGAATSTIAFDPLAALVSHYQADRMATTAPDQFASIVFHGDGGARVLCAKLVAGKLPADDDDNDDDEDVGFISKILSLLLPCF
jgi:Cu/Zn superoxide dismutase